ncbi:TPA_asm: hypothetical protein GHP91_04510 [Listeria monocytogenes]|nr:hypothetical protein [Listeria monocytogenes]
MKIYEAMMNKINQHNARILANWDDAIDKFKAFRRIVIPLLEEANECNENEKEKAAIKLVREMLFITKFNAEAREEYNSGEKYAYFVNNIMFYDSFEGNESYVKLLVSECDSDRDVRMDFNKTIRYYSSDINREYGNIENSIEEVLKNNKQERMNNIDLINKFNIHRGEL